MHNLTINKLSHSRITEIKNWHEQNEYDYDTNLPDIFYKLKEKIQIIYSKIESFEKNDRTYNIIHSDIAPDNILINNEISLIDFQDCEKH